MAGTSQNATAGKSSTTAGIVKPPIKTPVKAPLFKIEPMVDATPWLKMLIYGTFGIGKTHFAGTCVDVPSMGDIILANAEAGALTLAGKSEIDVVNLTNFKQMSELEKYLKLHCRYRDEDNEEKLREYEALLKGVEPEEIETPKKYRTIIVDSLTELDVFSMYQELGITDATSLEEEVSSPEWADYGRNLNRVSRTIRKIRDLPMNIIIICSASYSQDETKRRLYQPSLTGKLTSAVQGFMDVVGYLAAGKDDDGKPVRRLYVNPSDNFAAKNRFANFKGNYFDNPTMSSMLKDVGLYK